jgi:hypothetical protein
MRAGGRDRRFIRMPRGRTDLGDDILRYTVQCALPDGLHVPVGGGRAELCGSVIEQNAEEGMAWVRFYGSDARTRSARPGARVAERLTDRLPCGRAG